MLERPIITLTTDFGLKDPFVGLMKGVILGINPEVSIVDLSHNISRHNIVNASQTIAMSYNYFPPSTIHVAVTDPGVGSKRRPIIVKTEKHIFVGPDNGIFTPVLRNILPSTLKVFHITASDYFLPMSGSTFHGRDIFAPVAAWLSRGLVPEKFGPEIEDYELLSMPKAFLSENHTIKGEIVYIDNFGNAISNISIGDLDKLAPVEFKDSLNVVYKDKTLKIVNFYSENNGADLAAIINSFGQLELFSYKESASVRFDIKIGDSVIISRI